MLFLMTLLLTGTTASASARANNQAVYKTSQQNQMMDDSFQFLYHHNLVRARKLEPPLSWDSQLAAYAAWWAAQRRPDCALLHSFPDGQFTLGENIYWGGGSAWKPADAVVAWAGEERYYDYRSNRCAAGQVCGHYTQIVWRTTQRLGCARVVCYDGDVFMTCNYYPPGNYVGQRPY